MTRWEHEPYDEHGHTWVAIGIAVLALALGYGSLKLLGFA